jgi:hypothetical protein
LAAHARLLGRDPEKELHRVVENQTKAASRLAADAVALLEKEYERRRERGEVGLSVHERRLRAARHPMNEAHRKRLRLTLRALVRIGYVSREATYREFLETCDPEKKSPIWANLPDD